MEWEGLDDVVDATVASLESLQELVLTVGSGLFGQFEGLIAPHVEMGVIGWVALDQEVYVMH